MSVSCPACVKTCPSRECAELFSLFSSFDGDRQSGSFVIERNRDRLSTHKFDVGVFTQAGPISEVAWLQLSRRNSPLIPALRWAANARACAGPLIPKIQFNGIGGLLTYISLTPNADVSA